MTTKLVLYFTVKVLQCQVRRPISNDLQQATEKQWPVPSPWSRSSATTSCAVSPTRSTRVGGRSRELYPPLHHLLCRAPVVT
jgi:hypothetical protein